VCLILFSYNPGQPNPLIVAANRDEFYARPAAAAHYWKDAPHVFAGRDETAGGTWLGVTRSGRFAALTNFSAGDPVRDYPASRGELVAEFLRGDASAEAYLSSVQRDRYAGFNLLLYDGTELHCANNKGHPDQRLEAGCHGLSNAELTAPWPKTVDGAQALAALQPESATTAEVLGVLGDATPPPDERLPDNPHLVNADLAYRRRLAAKFIAGDEYGTRAMTVVRIGTDMIDVFEQQVGPGGHYGSAVSARIRRDDPPRT